MTEGSFVPLPGSQRETISGVQDIGPVDEGERIEVTLMTRRRAELPTELVTGPATVSTEELAGSYGTDPADIDRVREILAGYGLEVTGTHPGSRRVKVAGTAAQLTRTFGTTLRRVSSPDPAGPGRVEHRYREGRLLVPAGLEGIVLAVLGLDDRPQASPHFRVSAEAATPVLIHATAGRAGLSVPAGDGRDRPDDRRPRIRRRLFRQRPSVLFFRPRPYGAIGHRGKRQRRIQRSRLGPERGGR